MPSDIDKIIIIEILLAWRGPHAAEPCHDDVIDFNTTTLNL